MWSVKSSLILPAVSVSKEAAEETPGIVLDETYVVIEEMANDVVTDTDVIEETAELENDAVLLCKEKQMLRHNTNGTNMS